MFKLRKIVSASLVMAMGLTIIPDSSLINNKVYAATTNIVTINPSLQYQTIDGWGTSLAWWGRLVGDWNTDAKNEIMDLAFDKDKGLGLNLVRYNIGGAKKFDNKNLRLGADIESYLLEDGTYDWTKDKGQRWVLNEAKKRVEGGGDKFISEAFSNSPPYFMTKSGLSSGGYNGESNLKEEEYENFAKYLTNVVQHFKSDLGITFDTIAPVNEPSSHWWKKDNNQEGCAFESQSEKDRIYKELGEELANNEITTKLSGFDENGIDISRSSINSTPKETIDAISQVNTHVYAGGSRTQLRDLAASLKKPLYMTEICTGGPHVHDHENMQNGLELADIIFNDLRYMKVPAWDIWQVVDDESMNEKNNSNWGFIHAYLEEGSENYEKYFLTKQYYAMAQFSKYIRPGYKIIDTDSDDVVAAIDTKTNNLVLVTRNTSNTDKSLIFDLSKFNTTGATVKTYTTTNTKSLAEQDKLSITNGRINDNLPKESIVTYVISNATYSGEVGTTVNDNVIGDDLNQFNYSGSWSYYDSQSNAYSNDVHYTNATDDYCQIKFNGNKVQLYGTYSTDAGIAGISVDGGDEIIVDLYSSIRSDNALIYTSKLLNDGNHTIKVRVTGNKNNLSTSTFLTVDGAVALKNSTDDVILKSPQLINLIGGIKNINIKYNPVKGADSYNIKYGKTTENYTKVINNVKGTSYTISDLEEGTEYYVVVSAVINDVESGNSNELSEITYSTDPNTIYYVNCGDETEDVLENGEKFGTLNSKEDQPYGVDSLTRHNWGYIADENKTWSQDKQNEDGSSYGCLRQYDGNASEGGLVYKFEVPNGKYNIIMGFNDPWSHEGRVEDIVINGKVLAKGLCPKNIGKGPQNYNAEVTNGMLTVRAQKSASADDKPLISWIKVVKEEVTHNVIYDANGGEGTVPKDDMDYSANATTKVKENTLTKAGYKFIGWNTSADGSGTNYYPTDLDNNTLIMGESNITLYAQWKDNTVKVTTPAAVELTRNDDTLIAKLKKEDGSEFTTNDVVTYDWFRNSELVNGENNNTYKLSNVDKGKSINVKVAQYGLVSKYINIANDSTDEPIPSDKIKVPTSVRIKGTETVGETLEAQLLDKDGVKVTTSSGVTYQWYRLSSKDSKDDTLVDDNKTYRLVANDKGNYIKLVAIYDGKTFEDITSRISMKSSSSSRKSRSSSRNRDTSENSNSSNNGLTTIIDGWKNEEGNTRIYIENGQPVTGWKQIAGYWYLMDMNGTMQTGWKQLNNKWYLLKENGNMATGWQQVNNKWYLLKDNGDMATGWVQLNGTWYLLKDTGAMATGWQQLNGEWYYLSSNGSMASNTVINGYKLDENGAWIEKLN